MTKQAAKPRTRAPGGGRKPKPSAQKVAAGNPGKRAINADEPKFELITEVNAPDSLCEVGKFAWNYYAPILIERKVLTVADLHNLEVFCFNLALWRESREEITLKGVLVVSQGGYKKNPAITAAHEAEKAMASFGAMLGLDPSSRSRLVIPGPKEQGGRWAGLVPRRG